MTDDRETVFSQQHTNLCDSFNNKLSVTYLRKLCVKFKTSNRDKCFSDAPDMATMPL